MKIVLKMLLLVTLLLSFDSFGQTQPQKTCLPMLPLGTFPISSDSTTVLCYKRYVVGFSIVRHTAYWSAEKLTKTEIQLDHYPRKDHFRQDPNIGSTFQGSLKAYVGTDFDRGHLTNFEDLSDDPVASDESFFMTNMVPQYSSNNRGVWNALEQKVRKIPSVKGDIFIISGTIFTTYAEQYLSDGTPVPDKLFKIIVIPSTKEMITVIVPNSPSITTKQLPGFVTSIASLKLKAYLIQDFEVPTGYTELKTLP